MYQNNPYFATGFPQTGSFYNKPLSTEINQSSHIRGREIHNSSEISISEVPSDGSVGYFPFADGQSIMTKSWTSDGTIQTCIYVKQPEIEQPTLDDLIKRIEKLEKQSKTTKKDSKDESQSISG